MGITEILRRIWLFSANKIESSESFSKQPTQLIVEINSSLRHIIVTKVMMKTVAVDASTQNPYPWTMNNVHWTLMNIFSVPVSHTLFTIWVAYVFFCEKANVVVSYLVIAPKRLFMHHFTPLYKSSWNVLGTYYTIWNS